MTDSPDLPPEQDAVRRLLADARHDGATPPEVVARLDETLASLVAERSTPTTGRTAAVVDLGARKRRRIGTGVLAAAAVVVAGIALGQALPTGQSMDDAGTSAGSDAGGSADRSYASSEDEASGDSSAGTEMAPQAKTASPSPLAAQPTLSSDDARLEEQLEALRSTTASSSALADRRKMLDMMRTCALPGVGRGRRVAVEVDGQQGLVVFDRPDGASQGVAIYVCGTPDPVRTLTLPAA